MLEIFETAYLMDFSLYRRTNAINTFVKIFTKIYFCIESQNLLLGLDRNGNEPRDRPVEFLPGPGQEVQHISKRNYWINIVTFCFFIFQLLITICNADMQNQQWMTIFSYNSVISSLISSSSGTWAVTSCGGEVGRGRNRSPLLRNAMN